MPNVRTQSLPVPTATTASSTSSGAHLLLDEQAVHHLVQRAVAPDDDDMAVAFADGRYGQLRSMELVLREDRFAADMCIAQVLRDLRKVVQPAAAAGHGIDDDEPLHVARRRATFSGTLRSVSTRKS